jgi:hypothetical protein
MWSYSSGPSVVMMFLCGWWTQPCFPAWHALQILSFSKWTFVSPKMCSPFRSLWRFFIPTWASQRCQSQPIFVLAIKQVSSSSLLSLKSTKYSWPSNTPLKVIESSLLLKTIIPTSVKNSCSPFYIIEKLKANCNLMNLQEKHWKCNGREI